MQLNDLKKLLSLKFDLNIWSNLLNQLFPKVELFTSPAKVTDSSVKTGGHIGNIRLDDGRSLAIFSFEVIDNILIARNRKGLREIAAKYIDQSLIHGALVFYYSANQDDYRLTFIAKQTFFNENGELEKKETAPKRYTFLLGPNEPCTTAAKRLLELFDKKAKGSIYLADVVETFSVERLNKEFFTGYKAQYTKFIKQLPESKRHRDYVKKLLGRLVFLQFLQKKGWMGVPASNTKWEGGDKEYLLHLIERHQGNDFLLSNVLEPLFFNTLNEPRTNDLANCILGENIKIPYLNGGLFEEDELDKMRIDFSYDFFKELIHFFSQYNFTIDENDPDDSEVGIDPEMLGHIFENLLEDNKDKGAFYTPKEIVQYMSRQSIIQYLKTYITEEKYASAIDTLVNTYQIEPILQNKEMASRLTTLLQNVKVCDPAIGSGAFPMGVMNVLFHTRHTLHAFADKHGSWNAAQVKREIIQNNIFGVDIEQGAVDIARLRFWLALVVDADVPQPLPNLDYKITCGNSQIYRYSLDMSIADVFEEYNRIGKENALKNNLFWEDFTLDSYKRLVEDYTNEHDNKEALRKKIKEIKDCFKNTLAIGDIKRRKAIEKKIAEYEQISLFGTRKADEDRLGYLSAKNVLKQLQSKESEILNNLKYKNSFEWRFEYPQLLDDKGAFVGFDIIIANPPYIKEGRMSKTFFEPYKESPYYKGKMDIWYLFACNGLDLLNSSGVLCFIATNNWTTSFGASKLREKVIKETRICNIVDFGAVMMFESASIQTMIMMFQKDKATDNYTFDYRKLTAHKATEKEAIAILDPLYKTYEQAECYTPTIRRVNLYDKNITFSQSDDILDKIYNIKNNIFLFEEELTNGIHPHHDFINKKLSEKYGFPIGDGIFGLSRSEIDELELLEDEMKLIKPYYNSSDNVARYTVGTTDLSIIYTPSTFKNPHSMDSYPHLKAHLDKFKDVISSDNKPYGLHRARVESFFIGEKIVALRKCAGKPVFAYANGLNYMSATFYVIKTNRVNMKYLTGLLNSKLIEFWLKNKGKMQGANYQLDKEPLQQIPIVVPSIKMQEAIIRIVDYIIVIKSLPSNIIIDQYIDNDVMVRQFENVIDALVYELYFSDEFKQAEISFIDSVLRDFHLISNNTENVIYFILDTFNKLRSIDNDIRNNLKYMSIKLESLLAPIINI